MLYLSSICHYTVAKFKGNPMLSQRILILFAHPNFNQSKINRRLVEPLKKLEQVTFHDLYEAYPDFYIDVRCEQKLLLSHDIIAFMHPFRWYSSPAILKEWQDLVLEHGFAYGENGRALEGKKLLSIISMEGTKESYQAGGHNHFSVRQLLAPIEQTANHCGMEYLKPFLVQNASKLTETEIEQHVKELERLMMALACNNIRVA
jgi:glutathione-regulated potassium-efflux system ancillary protein KefG